MERLNILIIDASDFLKFRCVISLEKIHNVQYAISHEAIDNVKNMHKEGLDFFDYIFMEPYFNAGKYDYKETDHCLHTGWFIYRDLMQNLKHSQIIILTYPAEDYFYSENNHPERVWGENATICTKDGCGGNGNFLIDIIKHISSEEESKNRKIYYACERVRLFLFMRSASGDVKNQKIIEKVCIGSEIQSMIAKNRWKDLFSNENWLSLIEGAQNLSMMESDNTLKHPFETIMRLFPKETKGYILTPEIFT